MTLPRTVAEILRDHVTLEVEGIDRMYLNAVVPVLQSEGGIAWFFRECRGYAFASSALMAPMTRAFVDALEDFARSEGIDVVTFEKKQRKEDVAAEYRTRFRGEEGVLFVGKAQEKASVIRTERRKNPTTGASYAWLYRSTAMVNQYYFYAIDRDFGPFFLKFCSYFPYNAKLCINGHEYVKRQLDHRRIPYEALDNGILSCPDATAVQRICDELSAEKIDALFRKWLRRLPHPFSGKDRSAGIRYALSILQAEFSLTQVLDRPVTGRVFFEEVIRENLDIGRPDQVQLIFERRIMRKGPCATPGRFRTRVITEGVYPSLHVDYKATRIKQYHKEGRALRTETTINNTRDFDIGKRLHNLPALREVGFRANRRLLDVQRISHDCSIGEYGFHAFQRPRVVGLQRASALRFGDELEPGTSGLVTREAVHRPARHLREHPVVGEVELERGDGDAALAQHHVAIAARNVLVLVLVAADPVVLAPAGIDLLHDIGPVGMLAEARDDVAIGLPVGDVDVDDHPGE